MKNIPKFVKHLFLGMIMLVFGLEDVHAQSADSVVYQIEMINEIADTTAYADLFLGAADHIDSVVVYKTATAGYEPEYKEHNYESTQNNTTYEFYNRNFDTGPILWDSVGIYSIDYDVNQKIILEEYSQYNFDNSSWDGETKTAYTYLTNGAPNSEKKYLWDTVGQDYVLLSGYQHNVYETTDTYRDSSVAAYHVANRQLLRTDSVNYRFDHSDNLIEKASYDWDDDINSPNYLSWIWKEKSVYSNSTTQVTEEHYIGENQQWQKDYKYVSTYSSGELTAYQEYTGSSTNAWFEITNNTFVRTVANAVTTRLFSYDPSIDDLRGVKKEVEVFDVNDRVTDWEQYGLQEELYGPGNDDSWKKDKKKTYIYSEEIVNVDSTVYYYEILEYNVNYESGEFQESRKAKYKMIEEQNIEDRKNELIKLEVKEYKGELGEWKLIFDAQ